MNEIKIYSGLLIVLLVASYLSWHQPSDEAKETKVALLSSTPQALEGMVLETPTATVTVGFRLDRDEKRYAWIEVTRAQTTSSFVGNDAFDEELAKYAKLEAVRSLGRLTDEQMKQTGLAEAKRRLLVSTRKAEFELIVGERTSGARDFYVKRSKGSEVYLVRARLITDLQAPRGRFMQRQLRRSPLKDVARVRLEAGKRSLEAIHENRLSSQDAYWSTASAPGEVAEALGNYLDKVERLTAVDYEDDGSDFESASPILSVTWLLEDDSAEGVELRRKGEGQTAEFFARSNATKVPVKVSKFLAQQVESDLSVVFPEE